MRWGILSTARINDAVLEGARLSDRVEVIAVASRDGAKAQAYAQERGIERAHASYESLLADPDVEAVYISLPNGSHADWSIRALEAGKHVLCEKPLTRRPVEVERAFEAAEANDRFLMEAFMWRHNPQTKRARALLDEGAIGDLQLVRAAFSFTLTDLGNVRMRPELEGGALMDVGCYCISGARLLAGEPERVTGQHVQGPSGVDVRFVATLRFPGDVLAHLDCGFDLGDRSALEIVGSEGRLVLSDPWHVRRPGIELVRDEKSERIEIPKANSYQLELENLGDAIRGEAEPLLGREDALGQARTIDALYRSAESGSAVTL